MNSQDEFTRMICDDVACVDCDFWLNGMPFGLNGDVRRASLNGRVLKHKAVEMEWHKEHCISTS